MKKHKNTITRLVVALLTFTSMLCFAGTQSVTVAPGDNKTVKFDPDNSGNYKIEISAASGSTIKDSDFKAAFKGKTLWQKDSSTSYSIAYTTRPVPPAVGVAGTFDGQSSSGSGGAAGFGIDANPATTVAVYAHSVAFGNYHCKIVITVNPDDEKSITGLPTLQTDANGNKYFTMGAGPSGALGSGNLVSNFNRSTDTNLSSSTLQGVVSSSNVVDLVQKLINADGKYPDNLTYELFPSSTSSGYNSNGYVSGILAAVGATAPTTNVNTPGYNKPVPATNFQ